MDKDLLASWGFKKYPTKNKSIAEYEGINSPKNKMISYEIFPGICVMYINLYEKYSARNSKYKGSFGYRIAYCYEGNYYTHINDKKILITREIFVGKSIPESIESYSTSDRTIAFNIVISPRKIEKEGDYYKIIENFIRNVDGALNIGFNFSSRDTIFLANQLIEALKKKDMILISLKTLELIHLISNEKITSNRKKYYKEDLKDEIIKIEKYLKDNMEKDLDLDFICQKFMISKTNLNIKFVRKFQYTPIKYLNNLRMIKSEELLSKTDKEIIEIAESVGFKNPSNFTRSFKKFTGLSPSKYRKNIKLEKNTLS
ncbi:AraC family transcriptional regulator [uncultured Peptoniphilus sp.]|uniref:AraC family transcriptional regulator n=1 Tax=uncultured Peptoniphilus sp. TaxID=254354 RepID=UPI0028065002|nr:AraC family transcriptional regulator [uncultured Peptoniphilus sp.]